MDNLSSITKWQTWRVVQAEDGTAVQVGLGPDDYPSDTSEVIGVHPWTAIALRAFGTDTDNDDATVRITGWMDPATTAGNGPGQVLFHSEIIIGAISFNEKPLNDNKWHTETAWFEVDDWTTGLVAPSPANAYARPATVAGGQSLLILPTMGYTHLWLEIVNLGAVTEMNDLGVMWRPISREFPNII